MALLASLVAKWRYVLTILLSIILPTLIILIHRTNKCDMSKELLPLFRYFTTQLNRIGADYFIDYGTLLGAEREHGILAWDFDLDLAVMEDQCAKVLALREHVQLDGYFMFGPGEWITQKYNPLLGYDGYLHKACVRIYDANMKYYADLDFYREYSYDEVHVLNAQQISQGKSYIDIPVGYKPEDGPLLCNDEGVNAEHEDPGGCRLKKWIFPVKQMQFHGLTVNAPHDVDANLVAMYGDNWRIPRAKGYKLVVCTHWPTSMYGVTLLTFVVAALPWILYWYSGRVWQYVKGLVSRDSRPKYSLLPSRS